LKYSIDWDYEEKITVPVEEYEQSKPPRRAKPEFKLPSDIRITILQDWDYSLSRILVASEEARELRKLHLKSAQDFTRRQSMKNNIIDFLRSSKNLLTMAKCARGGQGLTQVTSYDSSRPNKLFLREDPIVDTQDALSDDSIEGFGSDDDVSYDSMTETDDISATHHRHACLALL
jgi:hypothetical protein